MQGKLNRSVKIGDAIKTYNSVELSRVDVLTNPKSMWAKVHQLTGRPSYSRLIRNSVNNITATTLNDHYAAISTDADYLVPDFKCTANNELASTHITE